MGLLTAAVWLPDRKHEVRDPSRFRQVLIRECRDREDASSRRTRVGFIDRRPQRLGIVAPILSLYLLFDLATSDSSDDESSDFRGNCLERWDAFAASGL